MSNVFTLDSLREEADKKFAPFKVELSDGTYANMRSLLRMNKLTREAVMKQMDAMSSSDDDDDSVGVEELATAVSKVIELVAGKEKGKLLLKDLDGDLGLSMTLIEQWMELTQSGEAESSLD